MVWDPGTGGPGRLFFDSFLTLLGFRARRARNSSVAGGGFLKTILLFFPVGLLSRPPFTGVPRSPGWKVPHRVLFEWFWAPGMERPKAFSAF